MFDMKVSVLRRSISMAFWGGVTAVLVSSCASIDTPQQTNTGMDNQVVQPVEAAISEQPVETDVVAAEAIPATPASPVVIEPAVSEAEAAMPAVSDAEADVATEVVVEEVAEPAPVAEVVDQSIPPNTFLVTSGVKDSSHLFYGVGSKKALVVNGIQGKELVAVRGQTYTFKVDTGVQHDFYLSKSPKGWGAATLTDGVKGNYTYKGVVTFTPDDKTPGVVYYQCRNHKSMGSKIHVVDKGSESKVVFGVRDESKPGSKKPAKKSAFTSGNQAKQKVMFAEMFISMSPAAKRIDASDHAEAKQILAVARGKLGDAKAALAAGKDDQAIAIVDEALRDMTAASQLVPSEAQLVELQAHFEELLKGAHTYEKSYRRNLKMMKKKGKKDLPDLDIDQISTMIADAQKLADNNQFADANKQLSKVQRSITGALTQLLADETMDYTLTFDNPQEEYEYELSRYKSYEELVPVAIEMKQPAKQTRALMERFVDKAKGIYALSGPKAREGDYKTAIQMLQGATSHLQRALRIVGVR